jgi:hypothetical protein
MNERDKYGFRAVYDELRAMPSDSVGPRAAMAIDALCREYAQMEGFLTERKQHDRLKVEGWRLVREARMATGPSVESYRSAAESWFWQHTTELLGKPPTDVHAEGGE